MVLLLLSWGVFRLTLAERRMGRRRIDTVPRISGRGPESRVTCRHGRAASSGRHLAHSRRRFVSVAWDSRGRGRNMADQTGGEVRMLIDGELVEAASGKRFDNINPATEEVLGEVADASKEDMQRAIDSSRRAFDETDWSTNHALPQALPGAAAGRPRGGAGGVPRGDHRRGRLAADDDLRGAGRLAHRRGPGLADRNDRQVRVGAVAPQLRDDGDEEPPRRHQRADGRDRLHRAVELPAGGHAQQAGTDSGHRQHDDH